MRYVAAYLLASLAHHGASHATVTEADIKKILTSAGVDVDEEKLSTVFKELDGKSLDEVLAAGHTKLASVPSGGGGGAAAGGAAAGAPAAAEEKAPEPEPEEESEEEDMGFGLFD